MATVLKKSRQQFLIAAALVAVATAGLVIALADSAAMQRFENVTYDARVRALDEKLQKDLAVQAAADKYVVIDIDNASYDQLQEVFGKWPWSRAVWTEVVRFVNKGDPKLIGIDIIFSGEEKEPGVDAEFARVVERSGKVVLAYNLTPGVEMETVDDSLLIKRLGIIAKESVPAPDGAVGDRESVKKVAINVPIAAYADVAAGMGFIRSLQDVDGSIRRVPTQLVVNGRVYPSLNLRMAQLATGTSHEPLVRKERYAVNSKIRVPIDDEGRMVLAWRLGRMPAQRINLWKIICSIYPDSCPPEAPRYAPEFFNDKIVLIGASAAASYDAHVMPLARRDEKLPGFMAHMTAVENFLSGRAVRLPAEWLPPLLIAGMALAGVLILVLLPSATWSAVTVLTLGAAYSFAAIFAFERSSLWLPVIAPLSALVIAFIGAGLAQYATTGKELRKTRGTLNRYMASDLVNYVMEHPDALAGQKKELTILFSDVRNFTTITESADPMELISTLNEYLAEMTDIIDKYYGITDKFIGDGILAYWGAFTPGKNHAELACRAAVEMQERLAVLNDNWKSQGRNPLAIGIGLNTGEVVFGNVGSGRKIEFTVIGDPVNLAARLESQTKEYGVKIMISEFTLAKAGSSIVARPLGGVKVKGKTVETQVFELQSMALTTDTPAAIATTVQP